jgi:DTW domain-containing protein YfiP
VQSNRQRRCKNCTTLARLVLCNEIVQSNRQIARLVLRNENVQNNRQIARLVLRNKNCAK